METSEIEKGFAAVFDEKLVPILDELEDERQTRLRKVKWELAVIAIFGLFVTVIVLWPIGSIPIAVFPIVGTLMVAAISWSSHNAMWKLPLADRIVPTICDFVGDLDYDRTASDGFELERLNDLRMIGTISPEALQDRLEGRYRNVPFTIVEVGRHSSSTGREVVERSDFRGLLFRIGVPEPVPTDILIARDHGRIGNAFTRFATGPNGRGMPRVETGHAKFEEHYELHTEDGDTALRYLPPALLDVIVEIGQAYNRDYDKMGLRAAFSGDAFFLALDRQKNFLEIGSLGQSIYNIEGDLHGFFDDLGLVREIIDRLIDA